MNSWSDSGQALGAARDRLRQELGEVATAIALVGSGGARSVTVAGLRFGDEVLVASAELAAQRGVVLEADWHADDAGTEIRVLPAVSGAGRHAG
jgi:hypothetical protein